MSGAILVVDDQPESLVALRTVLEPLGREVVTAPSGEEALKRLLQDDFSVIVMDVRMPGLNGFETVELIKRRERHEDTAIIFLTAGDADAQQVTRGSSAGAVDYMLKPVDPDMLRSKVAMLLELQQKSAELRASEGRFRAAFEGAPIGMGLSTVNGRWLEVNDALCELLGRSQTQLLRQPLWDLVTPSDREHERDAIRRLLRDRPLFDQSEKRFMRPDGEVVHAIVSVSLTADSNDRPQGYIWQVVDVTEQRRAEHERAARAEAEAVVQTIGKLQQVTEAALAHLELDELLEVLVQRVSEVFAADLVRIVLGDDEDLQQFRVGAAAGLETEPGAVVELSGALEEVISGARPVTLSALSSGAAVDGVMKDAGVTSLMASPLLVGGKVAGVVEVGSTGARRFTLEDESLLMLMADRAGLALEHARAYERELSNVEMLQRSLLPERLPEIRGIQVAAVYMPGGADVGGDWYDAIPLDEGRVGVAMGDVVGHGIGAASLMGQLRHAMRAYAVEGHSPAGVLDRLAKLVRGLDGGQMATLLYLVMEPDHGTVRFANAGHVPPLVIDPKGDAHYLESAHNPPLGVYDSPNHLETTVELSPGSTIVLYTDGLVEERGVSIDQGLEALRLAASQDACHPDELCDRLVESMLAIHPADDDIAVLALRALPTAPPPLHLEIPSDPTKLAQMRRDLGGWLRQAGAAGEVI
ncbi:MAG: SpoIIE family protein phosphatase, partial [Anaeromyxobacteraceae bacterium]